METNEWVDVQLESMVLGTFLTHPTSFDPTLVKPDFFTIQHMRTIWTVAFQEWIGGRPIDLVTVTGALQREGLLDMVGGASNVAKLAANIPTLATDRHLKILTDLWQRRVTYYALKHAMQDLQHGKSSIKDIVASVDQSVLDVVADAAQTHLNKDKELDEIADKIFNPQHGDCIQTAWPSLDKLIGGYRPEELVLMAGRPAMGKTALMVTAQRDLAIRGIPSVCFSLDMGKKQLWSRYISQGSGISVSKLESGASFTDEDIYTIKKSVEDLKTMPMWVDTNPYHTLGEIRMIVRQMVLKHGIKIVFIDHLGKIRPEKANSREQEVSVIVQGLKALAKEFNLTVVSLVQLNRQVEMRADKRPMLSDLRESGSIEQEADIVLMSYRPEYYNISTFNDGITPADNRMEVIAAKVRNGTPGGVILDFHGSLTYVTEQAPRNYENVNWDIFNGHGAISNIAVGN
jgi:replicative DNA helicase